MKVLLDENIDHRLAGLMEGHSVDHVRLIGLAATKNGSLMMEIESRGYDVFVTVDKKMRFQQNFSKRNFGMIVLDVHPNKLSSYESVLGKLVRCIDQISTGEIRIIPS